MKTGLAHGWYTSTKTADGQTPWRAFYGPHTKDGVAPTREEAIAAAQTALSDLRAIYG